MIKALVSVAEFRRIKNAVQFVVITVEGDEVQSHHFGASSNYINSLPFKSVAQAKGFLKFEGFVMGEWEERGAEEGEGEKARVIDLAPPQ